DLRTDCAGCGVFTGVAGSAPNRIFIVEWRTNYQSGGVANFEALLREGPGGFGFIYGQIDQGGSGATVGVQRETGSLFIQFECNMPGSLYQGLCISLNQPPPPCGTPPPCLQCTPPATRTPC